MHHTWERPDRELWKTFCDADPTCTYFQTPAWTDLITSLDLGWRDDTVLLRFPRGGEAIVPRVSRAVTRGLFRTLESVPPGVYGAPVVRGGRVEPGDLTAVAKLFRGVRAAEGALTEVPGQPMDLGARRESKITHLLALNPGDTEDALLMRYRKGHRADVLRARRGGVEPVRASSVDEIDGYYGMYRETVSRWQRTPYMVYPLPFFRALLARAVSGEQVRIWLARRQGQLLAGVVVFVHERHAAYWHAASTAEGRARHAGHLVLHTAILDASKLGVRTFDFMPSAGLKDVEQFKTGFAAEPADVGVHHFPGSRAYRMFRWAKTWGVKSA
jgi:hypothetical protein